MDTRTLCIASIRLKGKHSEWDAESEQVESVEGETETKKDVDFRWLSWNEIYW